MVSEEASQQLREAADFTVPTGSVGAPKEWKGSDGKMLPEFRRQLGLDASRPVANSVTHPAEWAAFTRAITGNKKYLQEISPFVKEDKTDTFTTWMVNNADITQCLLVLQRRQTHTSKMFKDWDYVKPRGLRKMFGSDEAGLAKVQQLIDKRTKDSRFILDEDFPTDKEEIGYWVRVKVSHREANKTDTVDEVSGTAKIRAQDAIELGGASGSLALPPTAHMNPELAKQFHAGLHAWPKAKPRAKPTAAGGSTIPAEAVTPPIALQAIIDKVILEMNYIQKVQTTCEHIEDAVPLVERMVSLLPKFKTWVQWMQPLKEEERTDQVLADARAELTPDLEWIGDRKKLANHYMSMAKPKMAKAPAKAAEPSPPALTDAAAA